MRIKKQKSPALERAVTRAAAISSIDVALDLGNAVTLASYKTTIDETRAKLDAYNTLLSQTDEARTRLAIAEEGLTKWSRRMLSGVLTRFGPNSAEYQKAGGTRDDERRRPVRAARQTAVSAKVS